MDAQQLANLAVRDLEPLLAATASIGHPQQKRRKRGGRYAPGNQMWVSIPGGLEVTLTRSLPLHPWEAALLEPYGDALADLDGIPDSVARNAGDEVSLRAIAAQMGGSFSQTVEKAIRFLFRCAVATYEGQPVHLNLLVDLDREPGQAVISDLDELDSYDWYALLGSGLDTGLIVDQAGGVVQLEDVRLQQGVGTAIDDALRPDAFRQLGDWSKAGNRIALSLARSRELLIQQGTLRYVYRSGRWRGLPLTVALSSGWSRGASLSRVVKQAALASVIDASLGHHGACLAIVSRGKKSAFIESGILQKADQWPTNVRSRLFASHQFRELTRRQRLELLSMDGATVLDHTGNILTAGAIIAVGAGSTGGGRLAATKSLARFGSAFKVSQDGPIWLYGLDANDDVIRQMALA